MNVFTRKSQADGLWNIIGSFGKLSCALTESDGTFSADNGIVSIRSEICSGKNGVHSRLDTLKNISGEPISLNTLSAKFTLDGGEYDVYTQYSGWLNESLGAWQPLVTGVTAHSASVRNTQSSVPFMVLWNKQTNRGVAFHLNAYSAWEMRVSRVCTGGEASYIELEFGVLNDGLCISLSAGEEYSLPEVIYYDVFNKIDMDAWRLHGYINEKYPRKVMPVIYNTWLYKFDHFSFDDILKQVHKARELGVEYFVVDAGWFGDGEKWWSARGDWDENQTFGFCGRMSEIADEVRKNGMKFGFWLEPETAIDTSASATAHPEYYIPKEDSRVCLLDFANDAALDFIFNKTCELIDRYGAEFLKFDFNADLFFDKRNTAFSDYFKGHTKYIKMLRKRYPALYIENCASGGTRMSLRDGKLYDSFWLSDDQSPYNGLRIFKDTLLRMPPQWIECWASIRSVKELSPKYGESAFLDKIISTNDATWNDVAGVHASFLKGFLTGSPIGLSFDLTGITEEVFGELKDFIAQFKENREFWKNAVCHILTDTESMLVLEFRNDDFSRVELVVFAKKIMQENICVYPILDALSDYELPEKGISCATKLMHDGIDFGTYECFAAQFLTLKKGNIL